MLHERFHYKSLSEVQEKTESLGVLLPFSDDINILKIPLQIGSIMLSNRMSVQPMEGCDSMEDGTPTDLTLRRYDRFARGGAGLVWLEAVAVLNESRANPRQLMLTESNLDVYKKMIEDMKSAAMKSCGKEPAIIIQATHSGRYSKPNGVSQPCIIYHNTLLEASNPLPSSCILSDDYLKQLSEWYGKMARLAQFAGFDGVDVKACHGYLLNESFSAYDRPGPYGGSFDNRTRLFLECVESVKSAISSKMLCTTRMNVYDGLAMPYGWGAALTGENIPDMTEPVKLIKLLRDKFGVGLINVTVGNPYFNPHLNRPFDNGTYTPQEHPLESIDRVYKCIKVLKNEIYSVAFISSLNSYLRQFSSNLAAGILQEGSADIVGFGRMSFAYPQFAMDLLNSGVLVPEKCCIACSKCTELMRSGSVAGCVIRDSEVYMPYYKEHVLSSGENIRNKITSF